MSVPGHYETDKHLSEYGEFHYGDRWFGVENFPKALADLAIATFGNRPAGSALDLGCASGRASFELARHFEAVTGIDYSHGFIRQASTMAEQGELHYTLTEEGELVSHRSRSLAELGLAEVATRVSFHQGDACNLAAGFSGYDLVLAANLIDRLYSPARFLEAIRPRIRSGGLLVIASPYTWLEEHTPREEWLGGFRKDGRDYTTLEGLKDRLCAHFKLLGEPRKLPFVIRETANKYQHSLSEVTVWERRA